VEKRKRGRKRTREPKPPKAKKTKQDTLRKIIETGIDKKAAKKIKGLKISQILHMVRETSSNEQTRIVEINPSKFNTSLIVHEPVLQPQKQIEANTNSSAIIISSALEETPLTTACSTTSQQIAEINASEISISTPVKAIEKSKETKITSSTSQTKTKTKIVKEKKKSAKEKRTTTTIKELLNIEKSPKKHPVRMTETQTDENILDKTPKTSCNGKTPKGRVSSQTIDSTQQTKASKSIKPVVVKSSLCVPFESIESKFFHLYAFILQTIK
jgi:hypothetical protein